MLRAEGLTKRYGEVVALADLELEVRPGEVYCLLGPNGAGKSTTMNLFLGFTAPTAGRAWVCGLDVAYHPIESKRHLAYIPEQVHLYPHLSGAELTGDDVFAWARGFYLVQRTIEEETAPRFAAFEARVAARAELVRAASLLSPAVLVHDALSELSGTCPTRSAAFAAQVRDFADGLHAELSPRLFAGRRLQSHEYDALPRFVFREDSPAAVVARLMPSLLLLLAAPVGLMLWGDRELRRGGLLMEESER